MPENVADGEVKISGDLTSLKSFVLEVKRALSSLEKGKVDVTLNATDKVTPEVKKVTKQVGELDKKKATPKLAVEDKATHKIEGARDSLGRFVAQGQRARPTIDVRDEASAKLERIGQSIKRYISGATIMAGVYLLGRAVKSLGGSMIDGASNMEQYRITLENLMGSAEAAGSMLDWVVKFAAKTPFEIPGLMEATVRLQAYGIDARDVLGTIGDASAALGKDVMDGVEAVADAQTGEFERLKEFGIKAVEVGKDQLAQYALGADAMGKTMLMYTDKNGKEAFKIVDRNNREVVTSNIMAIWNERYAGMMSKQADSWKGMVSNIKDSVTMGLTKVGETIIPILKPYLEKAMDFFSSPAFSGVLDTLSEGIAAVLPTVMDLVGAIAELAPGFVSLIEPVGEMANSIMTGLKPMVDILVAAFNTDLAPALGTLFTNLGELVGKIFEVSADTGLFKDSLGIVGDALNGVADILSLLTDLGLPQFLKFLNNIAEKVNILSGGMFNLIGYLTTLKNWFSSEEELTIHVDKDKPLEAFKLLYEKLGEVQKTENPKLNDANKKTMAEMCNTIIKAMPVAAGNQKRLMNEMKQVIATTDMRTVTAVKLHEMAQTISDTSGVPVEQVLILLQAMTGKVTETDMATPTANMMGQMESRISNSDAPDRMADLASRIRNAFGTAGQLVVDVATRILQHGGGPIVGPAFHGGGAIGEPDRPRPIAVRMHSGGEVPIIAEIGEYMMQRSAVQKYGPAFMNAVNSGRFGVGGTSVHQHNWGPNYFPNVKTGADAEALRREQNRMAEDAEAQVKSAGGYTR